MQGWPFYSEGFVRQSVLLIDIPSPYGNIVWGNNYKTRLFSSYTESSKLLFQKLEILNVNQLNNQQTIIFFIDLFDSKLP